MESVFKFSINKKPVYHKTTVDVAHATVLNIFRSLWVNKVRYLARLWQYRKNQNRLKSLGKLSLEDLAAVTAIVRPGPLKFNSKPQDPK